MTYSDWILICLFIGLTIVLTPLLGIYIANIFTGKAHFVERILGWLERLCYGIGGIDPKEEMTWIAYGKNLLIFNLWGLAALIFLQLLQGYLPLNPQGFGAVSWSSSINTAISFVTNTN